MSDLSPALAYNFVVNIDGVALGTWNKVSGLSMTIATSPRNESAMTYFQHNLPGPLTYDPITLERLVNNWTSTTMMWFQSYHAAPVPGTAAIVAMSSAQKPVMEWNLLGVVPYQWKGPAFDAGNATGVGTETLSLKFMGFA